MRPGLLRRQLHETRQGIEGDIEGFAILAEIEQIGAQKP